MDRLPLSTCWLGCHFSVHSKKTFQSPASDDHPWLGATPLPWVCPDNDFDLFNAIRLKAAEGAPPNVPELQFFDPPNFARIFRIRGVDLTTR